MSIIVLLFALASPARAAPDHVLLARICVSEEGWIREDGGNAFGCAAISMVLRSRAETQGWTFREAMQRYSPRSSGVWRPWRTRRLTWVSTLNEEGTRPHRWPGGLLWSRYRDQWFARLDHAYALIADPPRWEDHCTGPVHHWGAAHFRTNADRYGWVRVRCWGGAHHNALYCAPGLSGGRCRAHAAVMGPAS